MKFLTYPLSIIFLTTILIGCDPAYHVDYKIINNTDASIKILMEYQGTVSDTNMISTGTSLVILEHFGLGSNTREYLHDLTVLPMELSIFDNTGHSYNKSEEDITNWHIYNLQRKADGLGVVELTVRPQDFQ